jgi:drug efflux transport system permease protein
MFERLKQMFIKEFLQIFRDPRMRMIVFVVPIIQLLVLAFALTTDVTDIRTAVVDYDNTPSSREVLKAFTAGGYFEITEYAESTKEIDRLLDQGKVSTAIVIPTGFEDDLLAKKSPAIQILADGTDSNTTSIVFGYANNVIAAYSHDIMVENMNADGMRQDPVSMETRAWYNPNMESKYFYVPSLIAVMLILISMLLSSIAIVKEKEIGTIEQVMVTPISKIEYILGKTLPFLLIGYIVMTLMFVIAMLVFGIRINGSWLLLYVLAGIYIAGNLGIALLISVGSSTQQQALLTAFLVMMPAILLSGFLFPVSNMPVSIQYLTFLNPMRWFIDILRGVVMKGVGIADLWPAIIGQTVLAVTFIFLAATRFKKTMS